MVCDLGLVLLDSGLGHPHHPYNGTTEYMPRFGRIQWHNIYKMLGM